jgi:hypothetical protein
MIEMIFWWKFEVEVMKFIIIMTIYNMDNLKILLDYSKNM